jgi:hypothetical protein
LKKKKTIIIKGELNLGNKKGLSLLALLLSLIAVGLGGYNFFIGLTAPTSQPVSQLDDIYYMENTVQWFPTGVYTVAAGMSLDVEVKEGQNMLLLFDSEVILTNSATLETVSIRFSNNGTAILSSTRTVADAPTPTSSRLSLTTQDILLNLAAGSYTITVESYATGNLGSPTGNRIESCSFAIIVYN